MKPLYKLKQVWIRRYMWRWCFDCWFRVMYPHIYHIEYGERDEEYMSVQSADDMWWFWEYLNNLGGVNDD